MAHKGGHMEIKVIIPRNEVVFVANGEPLYVEPLTDGEKIVEVGKYNDFVKPLYDEEVGGFIESATAEEIEIARPTPKKVVSEIDQLWQLVGYALGLPVRE